MWGLLGCIGIPADDVVYKLPRVIIFVADVHTSTKWIKWQPFIISLSHLTYTLKCTAQSPRKKQNVGYHMILHPNISVTSMYTEFRSVPLWRSAFRSLRIYDSALVPIWFGTSGKRSFGVPAVGTRYFGLFPQQVPVSMVMASTAT